MTQAEFITALLEKQHWLMGGTNMARSVSRPSLFINGDKVVFSQFGSDLLVQATSSSNAPILKGDTPIELTYQNGIDTHGFDIEGHVLVNTDTHGRCVVFSLFEVGEDFFLRYRGNYLGSGNSPDESGDGEPVT